MSFNKVAFFTKSRLLDGIKTPPAFGGRCEYARHIGILPAAFGAFFAGAMPVDVDASYRRFFVWR
jgi:hypothetical protein